MSFTRTQHGDRVVFERNGAQVEIGPDPVPCYTDTHVAITLRSRFWTVPPITFGFDEDELADLIDELIEQHDQKFGTAVCSECVALGLDELSATDDPFVDDWPDWRDLPVGKTVRFSLGDEDDDSIRLVNRMLVPFQVGELLEYIDGLQPEDVVEFHLPVGG